MVKTIDFGRNDLTFVEAAKLKIGLVVSRFNFPLCDKMRLICLEALMKHGISPDQITVVMVPGALEIPFALQSLAFSDRFDGLIALGVVIRGETYHFEVVSLHSAEGLLSVGLDQQIPIANGILTVENEEQAEFRLEEKAMSCASVVLEMIAVLGQIGRL